jgi:hypothetical protein
MPTSKSPEITFKSIEEIAAQQPGEISFDMVRFHDAQQGHPPNIEEKDGQQEITKLSSVCHRVSLQMQTEHTNRFEMTVRQTQRQRDLYGYALVES